MKVVLDTNVWLSGIFWEGEASKIIELAEKRKIIVFISKEILYEIADVLNNESKFRVFLENRKEKIEDIIRVVLSFADLVQPTNKIDAVKDHPADNIFLEAAQEGKANCIVSYDKHLLNLIEFNGIKIIKPDEFLRFYQ